jgi:hypothetical protein
MSLRFLIRPAAQPTDQRTSSSLCSNKSPALSYFLRHSGLARPAINLLCELFAFPFLSQLAFRCRTRPHTPLPSPLDISTTIQGCSYTFASARTHNIYHAFHSHIASANNWHFHVSSFMPEILQPPTTFCKYITLRYTGSTMLTSTTARSTLPTAINKHH